jgi:hypothetical protein
MIPSLTPELSGRTVWNSSIKGQEIKDLFLDKADSLGILEVVQEFETRGNSNIGEKIYFHLKQRDRKLLNLVSDQLLKLWFTNPEVLDFYGVSKFAPFRIENRLPETDWSLLEKVYEKPVMYRLPDELN